MKYFSRGLIHFVLILCAVSMILPFIWMVSTSFKSPKEVLEYPPAWVPRGLYLRFQGETEIGKAAERGEITVKQAGEWKGIGVCELEKIGAGEMPGEFILSPRTGELKGRRYAINEKFLTRKFRLEWENYRLAFLGEYMKKVKASSKNIFLWLWEMTKEATFFRYFLNSIFVAIVTLIGEVITSALAAYAFARMEFPGREAIFIGFLAMMMVPQPVYLVPSFLILAKLHWIDTYYALIVPWLAQVFSIFLLRQHFKTIPQDLFDAAKIDGCSRFGFLWRIMLPLSKATLVTVSIFSIIGSWNSFIWPLVMVNSDKLRVIQVGLAKFSEAQGTDYHLMMAAATFSILPLLVIYFFAQKQIMSSFTSSGMKE